MSNVLLDFPGALVIAGWRRDTLMRVLKPFRRYRWAQAWRRRIWASVMDDCYTARTLAAAMVTRRPVLGERDEADRFLLTIVEPDGEREVWDWDREGGE